MMVAARMMSTASTRPHLPKGRDVQYTSAAISTLRGTSSLASVNTFSTETKSRRATSIASANVIA